MGALWVSASDVYDEILRVDPLVKQTYQAIVGSLPNPNDAGGGGSSWGDTVASDGSGDSSGDSSDGSSDGSVAMGAIGDLAGDYQKFYNAWVSFTNTANAHPYDPFPDPTEWAVLQGYEQKLAYYQAQANASGAGIPVITVASSPGSSGGLFPSLDATTNQTLSAVTYIAAGVAAVYVLGPFLREVLVSVGDIAPRRSAAR